MKKLGKVKVALLSMAVCAGVIAVPVSAAVDAYAGNCPRCGAVSTYSVSEGTQTKHVTVCANHYGPHDHTLSGYYYYWDCPNDGYFVVFESHHESCNLVTKP